MLRSLSRWHPLLAELPGAKQSSALRGRFSARVSPPQKGKANIEKIYLRGTGTPARVSRHRLPPARDSLHSTGRSRFADPAKPQTHEIGGERLDHYQEEF